MPPARPQQASMLSGRQVVKVYRPITPRMLAIQITVRNELKAAAEAKRARKAAARDRLT